MSGDSTELALIEAVKRAEKRINLRQKYPHLPCDGTGLSLVIAVYNNLADTQNCLSSLREDVPNCQIIVVDNGSGGEMRDWLGRQEDIETLRWEENRGVAAAWNAGLRRAKGEVMGVLNNDTIIHPCGMQILFRMAQKTGISALIGGMLEPETLDFIRRTDNPAESDYAEGSCLLFTRSIWEDVGEFDEIFYPAYCEDSDWCLRARLKGHFWSFAPETVDHIGQGTAHLIEGIGSYCQKNQKIFMEKYQAKKLHPILAQTERIPKQKNTESFKAGAGAMIWMGTCVNLPYLEKAEPYLAKLNRIKNAALFCATYGFEASLITRLTYPNIKFLPFKGYPEIADGGGIVQYGGWLEALLPHVSEEDVLILTDADGILQRDLLPCEIKRFQAYSELTFGIGYNASAEDTLGQEFERLSPQQITSEEMMKRYGPKELRCFNTGFLVARPAAWRLMRKLYEQNWRDFSPVSGHRSRCQYLFCWLLQTNNEFHIDVLGRELHSNGFFGWPDGVEAGLIYQGSAVLFRHNLEDCGKSR